MQVHGLWIEGKLSPLELLTIYSFISHGYTFNLWTYHAEFNLIPNQVIVRNAEEIIPKTQVFAYSNKNQFGHGKGSYAGFSDIFRYRLLFLHGGWWTDMDMTCLKRLPQESDYFFRANQKTAVGNLMYCPSGSPVMQWCYEKALSTIDAENIDWTLPIRILNEGIMQFRLSSFIQQVSNADSWLEVSGYLRKKPIPAEYFCIHWMHEEWRRIGISKDYFPKTSNFFLLAKKYQVPLINSEIHWADKLFFYIKTSKIYYILINFFRLHTYYRVSK